MKKLAKSMHKSLPALKIYVDEIQDIFELLQQHCQSTTILTDEYEIDDIQELPKLKDKLGEQIHELEIKGSTPYISIDLERSSGRIYLGDNSLESRGILEQLQDILLKGKRNVVWRFFGTFLGQMVAGGIFIGLARFTRTYNEQLGWGSHVHNSQCCSKGILGTSGGFSPHSSEGKKASLTEDIKTP
jgi:hypothetical protein